MKQRELRAALKRLGWRQYQLAEYLGVSEGAVSMWVNGLRPIPGPVALAVSAKLQYGAEATR